MRKIIKEPVFHFVLIGIAIFLLHSFTAKKTQEKDKIVIADKEIYHMISMWKMQWQREPTEEELLGLIDQYCKQEILYQETLKMNLGNNDEMIKRKLAQNTKFISNDASALISELSDKILKEYYEKNKTKYLTPYRFSFYQVVLTPGNHRDPQQSARQLLLKYESAASMALQGKGDPLPFPYQYADITGTELNSEMGGDITAHLEKVELNKWVGPLQSGFGEHLVFITDRTYPSEPVFESIRNELTRDYLSEMQEKGEDLIYNELRKKYAVKLELNTQKYNAATISKMQEIINR